MPKVKIVGMPKVRIVDVPKAVLGLEVTDTTTINPSAAAFDAFLQPGEHKNIANASYPSNSVTSSSTSSSAPTSAPVADKPRDINGCIIGEEQYDLASGICVPIEGGYDSKQDEQKNKPAVPVTNSSGQTVGGPASTGKTGPGTGVNPNTDIVVKAGDCPKGYKKNSKGECVKQKTIIEGVNDLVQSSLAIGNAVARVFENKEGKQATEATMRRKSWNTGVKPGGAMTFGKTEINQGVEFPNKMTPPNDGQYFGNYFGRAMGEFGGSFPSMQPTGPVKIKIMGEPDQQVMKYGGQSGYGFDSGWKRSYTEMNKISSDYYKNSMSEDKNTDEKPVLEAEGGETLYKPGDQAFFNLNGPRHSEGGIPLTGSQVNSKNKDVPSFIYSDTPSLKIKDKNILDHFGVSYKKGGVTPAEISKKYDLNKFKAILQDPNSDELAKSTAQLMIDKNERRLAELATIQEKMKGLKAPKFAEQTLREGSAKFGGFMPTYKKGGKGPDPEEDWIKKILNFETIQGSSVGSGLPNYGIKKSIWKSKYPDMWADNKITEKEAIDFIKNEYLPKVKDFPAKVQRRLVDYAYNTGRSVEDLLLLADGNITLDDINSNKTFTTEWNNSKDDIIKKAKDPDFIKKLDEAKTNVYKTTGTYPDPNDPNKTIRYSLNNPNPAYGATWQYRVGMFDDPVATQATGNPVAPTTPGPVVTQTAAAPTTGSAPVTAGTPTTGTAPATGGTPPKKSSLGLGEWSDDYEKLESTLMDDRNKELRKELFERYKKKYPKSPVTEEQYINNLLTAQKQNFAIRAAHGDDKYLQDEDWDKTRGGVRNKRYQAEAKKLGLTPLTDDEIIRFQSGYRDLEQAMHEPKFFETFGKYFRTKQFGKADEPEYLKKKTISKADKIYGNTTAGQVFELSGWTDTTTIPPPPPTTIPPPVEEPRYFCISDGKGGGVVKQLPAGSTGGYATAEEAAKHCPGRPRKGRFDYLLPDKVNMLAHAAIFPRQIFPYIPDMAYNQRPLALEDWRAKAAQRFSTQYAAPSAQLATFGPTQGLTANLSFLAGQTAQQMAAEDIAPTISRNIDRVNAYSQSEGQRQDQVDQFNLQNKAKRWEGYATTLQNYDNAMRQYLKENSDAFTRAWKNRMHLGMINDTNPNFFTDPTSGRQTWKGNAFYTGATADSGNSDLGKMYNLYYKGIYDSLNDTDEASKKKTAHELAMKQINADRYQETSDPYRNRSTRKDYGFDFGSQGGN